MKIVKSIFYLATIASLIAASTVLIIYGKTFNWNISTLASDWGSFGSLLGGCFTLIGALITALTFIMLREQQQLTATALQKQIDSLTFEQYRQHKDEFFKLIENRIKGDHISILDPTDLYEKIFPKNSPTEVTLRATLKSKDGSKSILGESADAMHDLVCILNSSLVQTSTKNLATVFSKISSSLDIKVHAEISGSGAVIDSQKQPILHLKYLTAQVRTLEAALYEIMFFGGLTTDKKTKIPSDLTTPAIEYLRMLSKNGEYKQILDTSAFGIIGLIKLSEATNSERLIHIKSGIDKILQSQSHLRYLNHEESRDLAKHLLNDFKKIDDWETAKNEPELEKSRDIFINHFHFPRNTWA